MNGVLGRAIFLVLAFGVCASAAVYWHEPSTQVIALGQSPVQLVERGVIPDHNLLLLIFSLKQGTQPDR